MTNNLIRALACRFGQRFTPIQRRQFVKRMLATGAAGALFSQTACAGRTAKGRVAIVGAGFSGLSCGYELTQAGYEVTLIEAKRRVGGRVFSSNARNRNEFLAGKNVEFGAELIGSNHPRWMHYADKFGLELLDMTNDTDAKLCICMNGKRLTSDEADKLWEEIDVALTSLNDLAREINADAPWSSPQAGQLDQLSLAQWIAGLDISPLAKYAIGISAMADNGQATERLSLLGFLTQVKGGGVESYWTETEVYRCEGGNDRLAHALADGIGRARIRLGVSVTEIITSDSGVELSLSSGERLNADVVVVSVAPTVWNKIKFQPELPKALTPQMGLNTKYFAQVKGRFWETSQPRLNQYGFADGLFQLTWDGTDNQQPDQLDAPAVLVAFSGGPNCEVAGRMTDAERDVVFGDELERLFPGYRETFIRSTYMNWPTEPWTRGSYSFPAPGQVTTIGPQLVAPHQGGRLILAGEHTCYKFVAYMEGALQSGLRAAQQII